MQGEEFEADIVRRLVACGLKVEEIAVQYQDDIQDYEIKVSADALPEDQIERIASLVRCCGYLQFDNEANAAIHRQQQDETARRLMKEQATGMPGLPRFDPARMSLSEWARELEVYCGAEPGTVLEVVGEQQLTFKPEMLSPESGNLSLIGRVAIAAGAALADHDTISFGIRDLIASDPP